MKPYMAAIAAAALAVAAGCSIHDGGSMMTDPPASKFTVVPPDGAAGVRLDAGVILSFAQKVDPAVTEANFHLIPEAGMADSACPVNGTMGHGNMDMAMADSGMMSHLDSAHHAPGRFAWSDDSLECVFRPDSPMLPAMRYMIHMGPEMMTMMEDRMGSMGMMGGHGAGMMAGHMTFHFSTLDTSDGGSGHDGHH